MNELISTKPKRTFLFIYNAVMDSKHMCAYTAAGLLYDLSHLFQELTMLWEKPHRYSSAF